MARRDPIAIRDELEGAIPSHRIRQLARETGAVRRERKVDIVALVWTLVLGCSAGRSRTFTSLRQTYQRLTGQRIVPSAFWDRFSTQLARMLKMLAAECLEKLAPVDHRLRGNLESFRDLIITDGSVIRLHPKLAKLYPGTRTNSAKAAGKIHMVWSVHGIGRRSVKISGERASERRKLSIGPRIKDCLLLFDLGYFSFHLFDRIDKNEGYFLSRLKANANPLIIGLNRRYRGRTVDMVGKRIQDVLPSLRRQSLDAQVQVDFKRRAYKGARKKVCRTFRLVGLRDSETGQYHLYLTNVPPEMMSPEQASATYRARWYIELLFKEMKSSYRLDQLPTRKKAAVEVFLYASILTFVASRRLLMAVRAHLPEKEHRIGHMRWASLFRTHAGELLGIVLNPQEHALFQQSQLNACIAHEAVDPHLNRPGLLRTVEIGVAW